MMKWVDKTPESVNADITRLFTTLRFPLHCFRGRTSLRKFKSPTIGFGNPNKMPENNYGLDFLPTMAFGLVSAKKRPKVLAFKLKLLKNWWNSSLNPQENLKVFQLLKY